jgi:hypothetical protein
MFEDAFDFGLGNDSVITYYEEDEPFDYDQFDYDQFDYDIEDRYGYNG